jgi:uncharacterized protein (DUF1501 family)
MNRARSRPPIPSPVRRRLLQAMVASGLVGFMERNVARAQAAPDYRALVCLFQQGGNDGENMLVRYDTQGYQRYRAVRPLSSSLNIAQADLVPIQPTNTPVPYGFHPACAPLKPLFDQHQLAVVANVGALAVPTTKAALDDGGTPRPANLFSHPDMELAVQSADVSGFTRTGWGGRAADKLEAMTPQNLFPAMTSINGLRSYSLANTAIPLTVPDNPWFSLASSMDWQFDAARDAALREILALKRANVYDDVAQILAEEGLAASSVVHPILQAKDSVVAPHFANLSTPVARQLRTIALMIEGRAQTRLRRQLFYLHQWGYDTHGGQLITHANLLAELSQGVAAFQAAMNAIGMAQAVTLFTMTEFGRTFKPASNAGTDHGWGTYAMALGGAVKGGAIYGKLPNQALEGPDDFGKEGRWIPTTSVETFGATLIRWLGVPEADLPYVFPNLGAFPVKDLGFLA